MFVADAIGEIHVQIRRRLRVGIIIFLMQRQGENTLIAGEDGRGAVPLVHIRIDDQNSLERAVGLQSADGHGNIVDHAEAFAVAREMRGGIRRRY